MKDSGPSASISNTNVVETFNITLLPYGALHSIWVRRGAWPDQRLSTFLSALSKSTKSLNDLAILPMWHCSIDMGQNDITIVTLAKELLPWNT